MCYKTNLNSICLILKDEKLQDVLGHFQKDFEGGVSAENLGMDNEEFTKTVQLCATYITL